MSEVFVSLRIETMCIGVGMIILVSLVIGSFLMA